MSKPTVFAIIPARGGSKRLPRKNIQMVWGKPMMYWSIRACSNSDFITECYVSTEDEEIAKLAEGFGAKVVRRPAELAGDQVFKQDVLIHAAQNFDSKPDLVVSVQANSPEMCSKDLDAAIEKLIQNDRSEIFSVGEDLLQNAAFRVMKYDYVFQRALSTRSGVFVTSYIDVHTEADLRDLEQNRKPCEHVKELAS